MSPWAYPAHHRAVGYSFNATKVMQNSDGPVYAEYAWPLRSSSQPLPFFSEFGSPPFRSHRPIAVAQHVHGLCCATWVRICDGFRTAGPLAELATRAKAAGPAFESRQ